jgi:hypothetical protein
MATLWAVVRRYYVTSGSFLIMLVFWVVIHFSPEDGGSMFFRNVGYLHTGWQGVTIQKPNIGIPHILIHGMLPSSRRQILPFAGNRK